MHHSPAIVLALVASLMLLGPAPAAPVVPSGQLPGRERDRFTESPVERFMQPGPYTAPQLFEPNAKNPCQRPARKNKNRRSDKGC